MGNDARTLYLLLSITFLAFLTSLFLPISGNYRLALFTTIGLPAVYAARYFSKERVEGEELRYFKNVTKKAEVTRDLIAVSTAFLIGYIVYMATSADFSLEGFQLYSVAFFVVLVLRYLISIWYEASKKFLDPSNPIVIVPMSFGFAAIGFLMELFVFTPIIY